jgi:hypothetical protein
MAMNAATRAIIDKLPDRLADSYQKNASGFAGNTVEMNSAGTNLIVILQQMWIDVVTVGFPSQAFSGEASRWINNYVNIHSQLYATLNERNCSPPPW